MTTLSKEIYTTLVICWVAFKISEFYTLIYRMKHLFPIKYNSLWSTKVSISEKL